MNFTEEVRKHLNGAAFSSGLIVPLGGAERSLRDRTKMLGDLVQGQSVIHVGFADHAELVAKKIERNDWLHAHICRRASRCIGVDVNAPAVENIRRAHGFADVFAHDLTSDERLAAITDTQWDWLLLPEVLEHIDNPVAFLTKLRELYGSHLRRVLITVPNALELTNLRHLFKRQEYINTDHRYWFTPFTLAKVCIRAGWHVDEFFYCQSYAPASLRERALLLAFPQLRESVAMLLRP